jgi:hypothetical protein
MLTDVAREQWADYQNRFMPLNQQVLDQVRARYGRDVKPAIGRAEADVRMSLEGQDRAAAQGAMRGLGRAGSGRGLMAQLDKNLIKGQALGEAQGGAFRGAFDQEFAGLTKLAAQGRGIQHDAMLSTAEAGNAATRAAVAKAGHSGSRTENFSRSNGGYDPWSDIGTIIGGGARLFGVGQTPAPSWESGVTPGNKTSHLGGLYTTTYYDPANDYNAPATKSSSGGFFGGISDAIGGFFGGGGGGGGSSSAGFSNPFNVY